MLWPLRRADTACPFSQVVDKFNDLLVSCYTTAGNARLLLLHDSRVGEEAVRAFFQEVHELYLKVSSPRALQAARLHTVTDWTHLTARRCGTRPT